MSADLEGVPVFPRCTLGPGVGFHFYPKSHPDVCMHCGERRDVPEGVNVAPHYEPVRDIMPPLTRDNIAELTQGGTLTARTPTERETIARELLISMVAGRETIPMWAAPLVAAAFAVADEFIKQREKQS